MHARHVTCAYHLTDRSRKEGRTWLVAAVTTRALEPASAAALRSASAARPAGALPCAAWGCWTSAWSAHIEVSGRLTRANNLPC